MKLRLSTLALFCIIFSLSSCAAIGGIFKTGVWFGVIGVVGLIALILYFVTRSKS